jgi:hypothetical protein
MLQCMLICYVRAYRCIACMSTVRLAARAGAKQPPAGACEGGSAAHVYEAAVSNVCMYACLVSCDAVLARQCWFTAQGTGILWQQPHVEQYAAAAFANTSDA